ncbi:cilia- and flagella-associated protein 263-like [Choristoneura fumiferana]|uniref:cilia- and flagella-associated protein 263-like n=1 Tax=Choristoneura fumiferana TaxID=7141 RepID=UPI003D1591C6
MSSQSHAHRSSTSQSRSVSHFLNDLDEVTDAELIRIVNEVKHQIKILTLENEIFEKTIMRLEPSLMNGVQQALEYAHKLQSASSIAVGSFVKSPGLGSASLQSPSKILVSPSRVSTKKVESSAKIGGTIVFGSGPRINVLERSELVATEIEILGNTLEKARKKAAKQHALLKAQLVEIGVRVTDIEKASEAFNQEVIIAGWDKIAQRIPAEIWIRYMTEWMKTSDSQIGKLRLRTSTLNTQYSKLKGQIKVKAELSEQLRPVDFEKLKIENSEAMQIIDKKFQQLGELKKMTGDANLNLTVHKKAMWEQNSYLSKIIETIKTKERLTVEIDKERDVIQEEADALATRLADVKAVRNAYEVPDIMDYVYVKAELTDLKHSVKLLENRVHIQQIALTSLTKKLRSMNA